MLTSNGSCHQQIRFRPTPAADFPLSLPIIIQAYEVSNKEDAGASATIENVHRMERRTIIQEIY